MKNLKSIALILTVLLLGFTNANAQRGGNKLNDRKANFNQLKLTDAQKIDFNKIKFAHEESRIELQAELKMNKLEVKKLLNENNFSDDKLLSLVEQGSNIKSKLKIANVEMWLKIKNILDDDQKKIWIKNFNKMDRKKDMSRNNHKKNNLNNKQNEPKREQRKNN